MRTFGLTNNEKDETGLWVPAQIVLVDVQENLERLIKEEDTDGD